MKIVNAFDIAKPLDPVWALLNDIPRVAQCIPGATVSDIVDNAYRVRVPIKIGILTITYNAEITVAERDDATHFALLEIDGRQLIGNGKVHASIRVVATGDETRTHVAFDTDAELGGFIATVGKPIVDAVARRTVEKFAEKLETMLS